MDKNFGKKLRNHYNLIIDNEIYFIEVGARGGGGHISDTLTPLSTGFAGIIANSST